MVGMERMTLNSLETITTYLIQSPPVDCCSAAILMAVFLLETGWFACKTSVKIMIKK